MNAADPLVLALENEGVKQIFGVPGEENLAIVEALRHSQIKLVLTRHEQAAAFMAATVGRLSSHAGVWPQHDDGRRLRAPRGNADGHDHRPKRHPQP